MLSDKANMSLRGEEYMRTPHLWEVMCGVATPTKETTFDGEKSKLCCDPSKMREVKEALRATAMPMFDIIDDFEVLTVERKTEDAIVFDISLTDECHVYGSSRRLMEGLELHNAAPHR